MYERDYATVLGVYKTFCDLDIVSIKDINKEIAESSKLKEFDFQSLLALFGPEILCAQFPGNDNLPKLDAVGNSVEESQHDDKDLRSLACILHQRTIVQKE